MTVAGSNLWGNAAVSYGFLQAGQKVPSTAPVQPDLTNCSLYPIFAEAGIAPYLLSTASTRYTKKGPANGSAYANCHYLERAGSRCHRGHLLLRGPQTRQIVTGTDSGSLGERRQQPQII